MKITKDMVGKKVTLGIITPAGVLITAVGDSFFLGIDNGGDEDTWCKDNDWEFYGEPKKMIRLAPVLYRYKDTGPYLKSTHMYASQEEIARKYQGSTYKVVKWLEDEAIEVEVEED